MKVLKAEELKPGMSFYDTNMCGETYLLEVISIVPGEMYELTLENEVGKLKVRHVFPDDTFAIKK